MKLIRKSSRFFNNSLKKHYQQNISDNIKPSKNIPDKERRNFNEYHVSNLETPQILIEPEILINNIKRVQSIADRHKLKLRPHVKTHKSLEIAKLQKTHGAVGFTCSKTDEAIEFIRGGFNDILVAYPIVDIRKIERLYSCFHECQQGERKGKLRVMVDHHYGLLQLLEFAKMNNVLVEFYLKINVGLNRCGLDPDTDMDHWKEGILKVCSDNPQYLSLVGIMSHAGHSYGAQNVEAIKEISKKEWEIMTGIYRKIKKECSTLQEVSVGSTPTVLATEEYYEGITEIRPGNYVFMDLTQLRLGLISLEDISFSVLATVVSMNDQYFIVDAGSKALSSDKRPHASNTILGNTAVNVAVGDEIGYGAAYPDYGYRIPGSRFVVEKLSEEHGWLTRKKEDMASYKSLSIGSKVRIIPNHSCPVANLFDSMSFFASDMFIRSFPIEASRKIK